MNPEPPEDDSILSAYLDGELDPDSRRGFELRLASENGLAEALQRLEATKALLSSLPRPSTPDLSADVVARIVAEVNLSPVPSGGSTVSTLAPRSLSFWGWAAAAALLIGLSPFLAMNVLSRRAPNAGTPPRAVPGVAQVNSPAGPSSPRAVEVVAEKVPAKVELKSDPPTFETSSNPVSSDHPASRELQRFSPQEKTHDQLVKLLDTPGLRKVFIVADKLSGTTSRKVADVIEHTARSEYYSINVAQGIVIDPEHPGQAKVFAFTIEESELAHFRSSLEASIGTSDVAVSEDTGARLVTQLSEIGDVEAFSPPQIGEMLIPRSDVAIKSRRPESIVATHSSQLAEGVRVGSGDSRAANGEVPEPSHSSALAQNDRKQPSDANVDPGESRRVNEDPGQSRREIVVLVWVTSPRG